VRWRRRLRRNALDDEQARELQSYIEIETDENISRGMSSADARRAAHRKLGNATLVREEIYRMNTFTFAESLWQDLRYGARVLWVNHGFTIVALLSLALGIGANTAIFQLIDAVRLRPLPVANASALVEIRLTKRENVMGAFTGRRPYLTYPLWERIRESNEPFDGVFAWNNGQFDLSSGGEGRYADGLYVSGGFFETLRVQPAAGRLIAHGDDHRGCAAPGAVISHAFWRREYGGDRSAVGRQVRLNGEILDIIGVAPRGFFGVDVGRAFDVAVPLCAEPLLRGAFSSMDRPAGWFLAAIGRLKPGWSAERASAHLDAISGAIFQATLPPTYGAEEAATYRALKLGAFPAASGVSTIRSRYETPLWALLATTALVLLIACANIANLMLARATAREREIAVRLAIGASRRRIVRQLMAEGLLLSALGAGAGALLAQWLSTFLVAFLSTEGNRLYLPLHLDARVFAFTALLAVVTCLLFALTPALRATQASLTAPMKSGGRSVTDTRERFGLRRALVVGQVALTLVLLFGALLFVRSLNNLLTVDLGFSADRLLVASVDLRSTNIPEGRRIAFNQELTERIGRLPSARGAAQLEIVPVSGSGWNDSIIIDGHAPQDFPNFNRVGFGFFSLMGTPFLSGRDFGPHDRQGGPPVAIVNESFARRYFGAPNAVGRTFQVKAPPGDPRPLYEVIGVVADTKYNDLRDPFGPIAFLAAAQVTEVSPGLQVVVRPSGSMTALTGDITRTMAEINPAIGLDFETMDAIIRQALTPERLMATLSGLFGGLAALIATIGLYGVISYMVARRKGEIGIRMALGASHRQVIGLVMRESAALLTVGVAAGAVLAVVTARAARTLLFGLQPGDPVTLVGAIALLAAVGAAASYLPALRAARVSPTVALREE
jgi:predicted permease